MSNPYPITFLYCPDCGKKGVNLRLRNNGEDHFGCKYCGFYVWCVLEFTDDQIKMDKLEVANPGHNF